MQTIWQRIKTPKGWRYSTVEQGPGKKTGDLQGPFYIRPSKDGKQYWHHLASESFAEAQQEAEKFEAVLDAASKGLTVAEAEKVSNAFRVTVKSAIDTYLEQKSSKARKTVLQYTRTLLEFLEAITACRVKFLDEITTDVLRKYKKFLENREYAAKTIDTRMNIVFFLLKKNNVKARIPMDELPTVEEEPAVPYTDEELEKLFAVMDSETRLRYDFFLGTACRDREVSYASWNDIDFAKKEYHIRRKPDVNFTPKSHESRTVPIPTSLVEALKARRKRNPNDRWIFSNTEGKPDNHFLRKLKKIALRAGVNCGHCRTTITIGDYDRKKKIEVTCAESPVCEHFYLHRFRKTCATRWLAAGVSLKNIKAYLGHKSLHTTDKYLGVTDNPEERRKIDRAHGD